MFHSHTRLPTVINGTVYSEDNYNNVFQSRTRSSQGPLPVTPSTRSSDRLSALPVSISLSVLDLLSLSINNFTSIPLSLYKLYSFFLQVIWSRKCGRESADERSKVLTVQKLIFLENLKNLFLYLFSYMVNHIVERELIIFLISYVKCYVDIDCYMYNSKFYFANLKE